MSNNFFVDLLDYLGDPGAHLRSTKASAILENLITRTRGNFRPSPEGRPHLTEKHELVSAMSTCRGTPDAGLVDDLLLFTLSASP